MEHNEYGRRKFKGLTIFFVIVAIICFAAAVTGVILYFLTKYRDPGLFTLIGGGVLFLVAVLLAVITAVQSNKYAYQGSMQEKMDRVYLRGADQVLYMTQDGTPLSKVQYDAICHLMDACRSGRISKRQYHKAKMYVIKHKQ